MVSDTFFFSRRRWASESKVRPRSPNKMKKQIALGLIAGAVALASTAFAPPEAQAKDNKQQLNQLAMQMYMQNMANQQNLTAQQQFYGNQNPYNLNNFNNLNNLNNPYTNVNNPYLGQAYNNQPFNNQFLAGNANFNGNQGRCQGNGQFKRKHRRNANGIMNRARAALNGNGLNNGWNNNRFNNGFNNNGFNNVGYNNGFLGNGLNGLNGQNGVGQLLNRFF
jgi:hypothetical protein